MAKKWAQPNCWMGEQNGVDERNEILFSNEKEWSTDACHAMGEYWNYCAKWKKLDTFLCPGYMKRPFMWNVQNGQIHRESK